MSGDSSTHETGTQSIKRALSVLDCFLGEKEALSLTDIAKKTGIPLPTASRITRLLEQEEYLLRNGENKLFRIGRKLYMLGYSAKTEDTLRNIVYASMIKLRDAFGETVTAYLRHGKTRRCFEKVEAVNEFRYSPSVGAEYDMGVGAGAKVFLAFMSEEERRSITSSVKRLTPYTVVDEKALLEELELVKESKIAKSIDEYCEGFSSLGSPIFNSAGEVICAITITGPSSRFTPSMIEEASRALVLSCAEITKNLDWKAGTG